jgi:DNA polymerase III subunit delta'
MVRAPMPFSDLIGQDRAIGAVRSALARGALHHAYLFGGPEGVGKGTAARLLAQAANCERGGTDPCGACGPCRKIAHRSHPDVIELETERAMVKAGRWEPRGGRAPSRDIVVDQVRDLVDHRLALKRFEGRRRFVIIDPADAMNPQAQNALLKTLEEPPDETTLVLVASNPDALLPTVRSRCARVPFAPLPDALLAERLKAAGLDAVAAQAEAALSGGSLARALERARAWRGAADDDGDAAAPRGEDGRPLAAQERAVAGAAALDPDDAGRWIEFAQRYGKDRERAAETCELLAVWLRDVLALQAAGDGAPLALPALKGVAATWAAAQPAPEVLRRLEGARAAAAALRQNAAPALALERMLIGWFHGGPR